MSTYRETSHIVISFPGSPHPFPCSGSIHPARGSCLLMCTDTSLEAIEIIRLYGLRFKIEHTFKQAVRLIGSFSYHFWMSDMKPLRRNNGDQHLHRASL